MTKKQVHKGLDGRMRDQNGEIRQRRSDTKVETLRKAYGDNFAKGYRSDAKLGTVLKREGAKTLDELTKSVSRKVHSAPKKGSLTLQEIRDVVTRAISSQKK